MNTGIEIIAKERQRQIDYVGPKPETHCKVDDCELRKAALSYAFVHIHFKTQSEKNSTPPVLFPFDKKFWNPNKLDDIKNLAKAGAYIAAEIDRLLELEASNNNESNL